MFSKNLALWSLATLVILAAKSMNGGQRQGSELKADRETSKQSQECLTKTVKFFASCVNGVKYLQTTHLVD